MKLKKEFYVIFVLSLMVYSSSFLEVKAYQSRFNDQSYGTKRVITQQKHNVLFYMTHEVSAYWDSSHLVFGSGVCVIGPSLQRYYLQRFYPDPAVVDDHVFSMLNYKCWPWEAWLSDDITFYYSTYDGYLYFSYEITSPQGQLISNS